MVSHGNEVNIIFPDTIDDVVGETRNDPLSKFAGEGSTCVRVNRNSFHGLLDG
jgi:hypothetical protein